MKILVTGAGGFLGARLVHALLRSGERDVRLHFRGQPKAGLLEDLGRQYPEARLECVAGNLLRSSQLGVVVRDVDLIIHAAAAKKGAAADMFLNTVVGTRNLLDAALAGGCRRVALVSSFAAFQSSTVRSGRVLDESCPMESEGTEKGAYGFAKVQQELLLRHYADQHKFEFVVLRPGVIYGPGDSSISSRVGIKVGSVFVSLGGGNILPLTYVDNCADAIVAAALRAPSGSMYAVVDDDLPTCSQYLSAYRQQVRKIRTLWMPHWIFSLTVRWMVRYNRRSQGQLAAILTPHTIDSMYRPIRYSNAALKRLGWAQCVSTAEGMRLAFQSMRG